MESGSSSSAAHVRRSSSSTAASAAAALMITDTELSECDREALHLIGSIQGGHSGHVCYFRYPSSRILAVDAHICDIPWIIQTILAISPPPRCSVASSSRPFPKCCTRRCAKIWKK